MSAPSTDVRTRGASVVFACVDAFARFRGVDDVPASGLVGALRFTITRDGAWTLGLTPRAGWVLRTRSSGSGLHVGNGALLGPGGRALSPIGPDLDVEVLVESAAYRSAGPLTVRLVNLDPSRPVVAPVPVPIELGPGYDYPLPSPQGRYAIARGSVLAALRGPGVDAATVTTTTVPASDWSDTYRTGPSGQFVVVLPDTRAGPVRVRALAPGGTSADTTVVVPASGAVAVPPLVPA